jgi:DNA-binding transcriptional LysR family regulator
MSLFPEDLACFLAAMRLPSFTAAARTVAITPAAFGQRIKRLEDQLGQRLFQRTTRRVLPTPAALRLLPYAEELRQLAEKGLQAVRGEAGATPIDLTVGTRHELGMSWLLAQLPALEGAIPALTCHLYFGSGTDLLIRLRTLEVDCAIGSMKLTDPQLAAIPLHPEEYVLTGAPRLLRERPLSTAQEAEDHVLVDISPDLPLLQYLREGSPAASTLRFRRILCMGTIAAIHHTVLKGRGVAVLPRYLVRGDLRARRLVPILPALPLKADHFRLVFRASDPRRALYERMAELLLRAPLR